MPGNDNPDNNNLEDRVLISLIVTGMLLGTVFFFIDGAKFLSAIFLSITLSGIVYRFLGGITGTDFTIGLFKLTGSAAFMIGCIWFLNNQLQKLNPPVDTMEITALRNQVTNLNTRNILLSAQNDSLNTAVSNFKKDLGLYYAQWHNNSRRNSALAIEYLLFALEHGTNIQDEEKSEIINSLVDCSQYISHKEDFDKLISFIGPPLNKFNQYRSAGRVYYHYADDPLGKLNLPASEQRVLWKKSFNNYLNAYNEITGNFSDQDKIDLLKGIRKYNNLKRINSLSDLINSVNRSDLEKFGEYLQKI